MQKVDKNTVNYAAIRKIRELTQEKILLKKLLTAIENQNQTSKKHKTVLEKQLKELLMQLDESERKYTSLYEGAPDPFRTIDLNGIIIDCNNAYATELGYNKEEILGKHIFEHVDEKNKKILKKIFETWKKTGNIRDQEIMIMRKDGTNFHALLSATNLYDSSGNLIGSNTIIKNISDLWNVRRQLEENQREIQQQFDELKKADLIKDEFLSMISHEMKTPLVPIRGYVDILLSETMGKLNAAQKARLSIIRQSADSLLRLVSDLLDAQKLELGKLKLDLQVRNITDIIIAAIAKIKPEAEKHGIKIIPKLQKNVFCICDKDRMEQVLLNLLNNAIDFTPNQRGIIRIKLFQKNKHAILTIKDNGVGIPKKSIKKIFSKFYQTDTSLTREHGGTGLGLSICRGIIENHKGKIWAESKGHNKGAEIHIQLEKYSRSK